MKIKKFSQLLLPGFASFLVISYFFAPIIHNLLNNQNSNFNIFISKILYKFEQSSFILLISCIIATILINDLSLKKSKRLIIFWSVFLIISILLSSKIGELGSDSIHELLSTNIIEAKEFIIGFFLVPLLNWKGILFCLFPIFIAFGIKILSSIFHLKFEFLKSKYTIWIASLCILAIFSKGFFIYWKNFGNLNILAENQTNTLNEIKTSLKTVREPLDIIVYIGESTSAQHQSFYGYFRDTNSPLDAIKNELIIYSDVMSSHSHTSGSLLRTLSIANDPTKDPFLKENQLRRANIVQTLNTKGYETVWLSNQNIAGSSDTASQLFGKAAQDSHFLNFSVAHLGEAQTRQYDDYLIPLLKQRINFDIKKPRAFFLHSYAGHWAYCKNIPDSFHKKFQDDFSNLNYKSIFGKFSTLNENNHRELIDCYDSALIYVSNNINSVINIAKERKHPTAVIYFSDHGEDVLGNTEHNSANHNMRHLHVPLYIYFNRSAKEKFPELYSAAKQNKDKPISLGWLSDSLLDLSGQSIGWRNSLSLFSKDFKAPPRYSVQRTSTKGEEQIVPIDIDLTNNLNFKDYSDDLTKKRRQIRNLDSKNSKKICSLGVNSFIEFFEASKIYNCIQFDITFDMNKKNLFTKYKLSLKEAINNNSFYSGKLILNLINFQSQRTDHLIEHLNSIIPKEKRAQICLMLTFNINEISKYICLLKKIRESGYTISYSLLNNEIIPHCKKSIDKLNDDKLKFLISALDENIFQSISFNLSQYPYVKTLKSKNIFKLHFVSKHDDSNIYNDILKNTELYSTGFESRFK